jgi:hypothetical protein
MRAVSCSIYRRCVAVTGATSLCTRPTSTASNLGELMKDSRYRVDALMINGPHLFHR